MSSNESHGVVALALLIGFALSLVLAAVLLGDGYLLERGAAPDDAPAVSSGS
jgi:hypothetical protein